MVHICVVWYVVGSPEWYGVWRCSDVVLCPAGMQSVSLTVCLHDSPLCLYTAYFAAFTPPQQPSAMFMPQNGDVATCLQQQQATSTLL